MLYGVGRLGAIRKFGGAVVGDSGGIPILAEDDVSHSGVFFNSDGTTATLWRFNDIDVYSLSTPYDLTSANFSEVETDNIIPSNSYSGQLVDSGTKFITGTLNPSHGNVDSYNLSTAYDFTTISSTPDATINLATIFGTKIEYVRGLAFSSNGLKMFAHGSNPFNLSESFIVEYTLSSAFDITTASYTDDRLCCKNTGSPDFLVGTNRAPSVVDGMQLVDSDTRLVLTLADGSTSGICRLVQYTMSSAADLTGMTITQNIDLTKRSSEAGHWLPIVRTNPPSFIPSLMNTTFSPDGTKLYFGAYSLWGIFQLSLSTPFDISTASFDSPDSEFLGNEFNIGYSLGTSIYITENGQELYITSSYEKKINQYSFGTAFDIKTLTYTGSSVAQTSLAGNTQMRNTYLNSDGTKIYYIDYGDKRLYQATLSTAYDITTMPDATSFYDYTTDLGGNGMWFGFNADGSKLYIGKYGGQIYQWDLATNFDVTSTKSNNQILDVSSTLAQPNYPTNFTFNSDGTKFFLIDFIDAKEHYVWNLSTAYDLSTAGSPTTTTTSRIADSAIDFSNLNNNFRVGGVKLVNDDTLIFAASSTYAQPLVIKRSISI
jgi:hypothetical protein